MHGGKWFTDLHSGVDSIIHYQQESRHNILMELLLENWSKVSRHLAYSITGCITNSWMGVT